MYHSVAPGPGPADREYNISPPRFWQTIALLGRLGLTASVALDAAPAARSAVITFDDGYEDLYTEVFPRFQAMGLTAVVFAVAGKLGGAMDWNPAVRKPLMTAAQMREMQAHGFRFGSHTMSHCDLANAAPEMMREEIGGSKARLEDILGAPVTLFSYPWGRVNARVRDAVAEAGFTAACTTEPRLQRTADDPLLIPRLTVSEMDSAAGMASKLLIGRDLTGMTPGRAWRWLKRHMA
jgi:peptidoglycan/xylan/chitin deacetylase (PgdA/CDA1 family)